MKTKAIAAAVGAAFLFGAGWLSNGWRLTGQHANDLSERDRQVLVVAQQVMAIGQAANTAISEADTKAWKGLEHDKKELGRLRGCVAAGTCGVRLITKYVNNGPSDSSPSSVGNDTVALDADLQHRVLDHRESLGEDEAKLTYLQAYALQCWKATQQP